MEIPEKVDEWSLDTVKEVVRKHEFEPGRFDYKAVLQPATRTSDPDHIPSIRRTVCSMANADGGFILFGVLDRKLQVHSLEDRIFGIPLGKDLLKEFGDKINVIQPEVYFEATPTPIKLADPTKGIFVVHVPTSPRRPHMVQPTGVFYRRGPNGTAVPMDYYEVREQMLSTEERLRKVTLLRLEIAQYLELVQEIHNTNMYASSRLIRAHFDTGAFKAILADICVFPAISGDLLKDLLKIPVLANLTQEALQKELEVQLIQGRAANLERQCKGCEQHLRAIFGPLGE